MVKIKKLSGNVFCFKSTCNVFIIKKGRKALGIDCGDGSVIDELSSIGVDTVEMALITHHHRDQCQGANKLISKGCRIAVPEHEKPLFADAESFWLSRQVYDSYNDRSTTNSPVSNIRVDAVLEDYSTLMWNGCTFKVLPTPGHTLGSVSIAARIDGKKWIFCGDVMREGGRLQNLYDLQPSYSGWEGVDQLYTSAISIQREKPDVICPSHGDVINNPGESLDKLIVNLQDWYGWCKEGFLSILDKENYPFGTPHFPSDFTPHRLSDHLFAFPNSCSTFYAVISDSGEAFFIDYGAAGWSHFWSHLTFREPWETQRFMEHSIHELKERFGLKKIEIVMPSHYHDDHVHGIPHLVNHYGTEVWSISEIADVLENPGNYALMCLFNKKIPVARRLASEEVFSWRGFEFKVWHYPGQTEHHQLCMLKIDGKKVLFTGDSLFPGGVDGKVLTCPLIFRNYHRYESHKECAEILVTLEPDLIAPGHGPVFKVSKEELKTFEKRTKKLLGFFDSLLPESEKWAGIDPFWVRFVPYQQSVRAGEKFQVEVRVRNYKDEVINGKISLVLPLKWFSKPVAGFVELKPGKETGVSFEILAPVNWKSRQRIAIAADVQLDGSPVGQIAETIVRVDDNDYREFH
jgi:glyoxylase-like metal-dependent hydrolase (beta-lactamase superfamily II)